MGIPCLLITKTWRTRHGRERRRGRGGRTHSRGTRSCSRRRHTIPKRSALFLFFACQEKPQIKETETQKKQADKLFKTWRATRWRIYQICGNDPRARRLLSECAAALVLGNYEVLLLKRGRDTPKIPERCLRRGTAAKVTSPSLAAGDKGAKPGTMASGEAGKPFPALGRWEMEKGKGLTPAYSWRR